MLLDVVKLLTVNALELLLIIFSTRLFIKCHIKKKKFYLYVLIFLIELSRILLSNLNIPLLNSVVYFISCLIIYRLYFVQNYIVCSCIYTIISMMSEISVEYLLYFLDGDFSIECKLFFSLIIRFLLINIFYFSKNIKSSFLGINLILSYSILYYSYVKEVKMNYFFLLFIMLNVVFYSLYYLFILNKKKLGRSHRQTELYKKMYQQNIEKKKDYQLLLVKVHDINNTLLTIYNDLQNRKDIEEVLSFIEKETLSYNEKLLETIPYKGESENLIVYFSKLYQDQSLLLESNINFGIFNDETNFLFNEMFLLILSIPLTSKDTLLESKIFLNVNKNKNTVETKLTFFSNRIKFDFVELNELLDRYEGTLSISKNNKVVTIKTMIKI